MAREMQVRETNDATITARVPTRLAERVTERAEREDRTVSYIVRRALDDYFDEREDDALPEAA